MFSNIAESELDYIVHIFNEETYGQAIKLINVEPFLGDGKLIYNEEYRYGSVWS